MRRKVPRIDPAWTSAGVDVVVHFCEVDAMRVAWHGHYARYCESAREAFFDRCGLGYDDLQARGWAAPVVHLALDFLSSARHGERLRVTAGCAGMDRPLLELVYEIRGADGRMVATGLTRQLFWDHSEQPFLTITEGLADFAAAVNHGAIP